MLHAELHGKLGSEASDSERGEDVLTSTTFGILFAAGAWSVLIEWLRRARPVRHQLRLDLAASEWQMYWFWPRLNGAEPDLVLRVGMLLVIIEAKYYSGKSGKDSNTAQADITEHDDVKDQLVREWRACSREAVLSNYPETLRGAIGSCDRVLVYLVQRRRLMRERQAVEQSLKQEPGARMYVLTWEDLDEVLAAEVGGMWVEELRMYLYRRRLTAFRGYRAAIGDASAYAKLLLYKYAPVRSDVDFGSVFTPEALPCLNELALWRCREACNAFTPEWAYIARRAALDGISRLAARSPQLSHAGT